MLPRCLAPLGLLLIAGCLYPVGERVDLAVCDLAALPRDLGEPPPPRRPAAPAAADARDRIAIPADLLPGGDVPPIRLPPVKPGNEAARRAALEQLFPELDPLGDEPPLAPGPDGQPLTLAALQKLALANSPAIKQAVAAVDAARGAAVQAGLPPNPTVGFEQDTANTDASTGGPGYGGPGYVGGYVEQTIKTANKLQLARAAAAMDLKNAELALIRARNDVATRVRSGYFAVLVARENVRTAKALARLTDAVYRMQVDQVALGGITPAYEPIQTRALALQAYGAVVQARNRATGAWKQLAAALGLPGLPPSELAGSAVMPAPAFEHAAVLAAVLARHTDVQTAAATLQRARYNLRLAQVTPVPDVDVRAMLQKDYTTATRNVAYSLQVGVPVPLWNRNQGGIYEAQARVVEASEQANRARAELAGRLAEAFERYQNARTLLDYYARHIIPDQVRVYRGVYERYRIEPGEARPGFADVVVAQQNLGASVTTYLATLGHFWQAVVDVADLLQTEDLFAGDAVPATECVVALPDLAALLAPPARLDCAPQLPGADAGWPPAAPAGPARRDRPERAPAPRPADDGLGSRLLEPPPEVRRRR